MKKERDVNIAENYKYDEDSCMSSEEIAAEVAKYPVMEIFDSIQGEGCMLGMPVTFIRFKGCNLACPWCDTKESWAGADNMFKEVSKLTISEIVEQCHMATVVLTGGEPCLQDLKPLITALHVAQKFVCIETNGTLPTPEEIDWVVASPKPPEYLINGKCFFNELKYVMDDNLDLSCIPDEQKKACGQVWLQPCDFGKGQEAKTKASIQKCVDMAMKNPFLRVGIQLHKYLDVK